MDRRALETLLERVRGGELAVEAAVDELAKMPFHSAEGLRVDTHRELRCGFPEAVYGEGKTAAQVAAAMSALARAHDRVLATRVTPQQAAAVHEVLPGAEHRERARCIFWRSKPPGTTAGRVCVVAAGTSDLPVADEAACTLDLMDCEVARLDDVGVAGVHRLLGELDVLRRAHALVVCAGMEGALPSVVGGLVAAPVVAVPTSVGYGASFGGLAALLGMMNSCAAGVGVVNIDNGFGGGLLAGRIARAAAAPGGGM